MYFVVDAMYIQAIALKVAHFYLADPRTLGERLENTTDTAASATEKIK